MFIIQGTDPRLKNALLFDQNDERNVILWLMVHLYNF